MNGIRDCPEANRDDCYGCGGVSLIEQTHDRIEARKTLASIYASMKKPPPIGESYP